MCVEIFYDGELIENVRGLCLTFGQENVRISAGYEPLTIDDLMDGCLCPVDLEATARALSMKVAFDGSWHYFIPLPADQIDKKEKPEAPSKRLIRQAGERNVDIVKMVDNRVWYCLTVTPQKETLVSQQCHERGIDTFLPIKRVWRKTSRTTRQKALREGIALPGYLLIATTGQIPWGALSQLNYVTGALGANDVPKPLAIKQAKKFIGRFKEGIEAAKAEQFMRSNHEYKVGDFAEIVSGPYTGRVIEVSSIRGRKAGFVTQLFGGEVSVSIDLVDLEAA